jgi:putative ABC transport system substrate-binding protein
MGLAADDPEAQARIRALQQGLRVLGWLEGTNLGIEYRYVAGSTDPANAAAELVTLIVARGTPMVATLLRATRSIPIVFTAAGEPITSNFVASHKHPGGTATGFTNFEPSIAGKWIELLKEIVPSLRRAGVVFNPMATTTGATTFLRPLRAAAKDDEGVVAKTLTDRLRMDGRVLVSAEQ